jgi:hypothetical protein
VDVIRRPDVDLDSGIGQITVNPDTDKQTLIFLSVILADGELNIFVVRSALLLYIVAQSRAQQTMPGKRAKILSAADVGDLLVFASCTRHPLRNTVIVLLSAKAGLRLGRSRT